MPKKRTPATKTPPRIMLEVTPEQFDLFKRHLPYGFQKQIFKAIVEDMCQMWEEFGDEFTHAIIRKNLTYKHFMMDYMDKYHGDTQRHAESPLPEPPMGGTTGPHQSDQSAQESAQHPQESAKGPR